MPISDTNEIIEQDETYEFSRTVSDDQNHKPYRDKLYWALPENVRHAVDIANPDGTEFYSQLCQMNDKIGIYKRVFYSKQPKFEKVFNQKKKKELEDQMQIEHANFKKFMKNVNNPVRKVSSEEIQDALKKKLLENLGLQFQAQPTLTQPKKSLTLRKTLSKDTIGSKGGRSSPLDKSPGYDDHEWKKTKKKKLPKFLRENILKTKRMSEKNEQTQKDLLK